MISQRHTSHRMRLIPEMILVMVMLASLVLTPASAVACGQLLANLGMVDLSHPPDPCVDAEALAATAVSSVVNQISTIYFPNMLIHMTTLFLTWSFLVYFLLPRWLILSPPTPPPKPIFATII